MLDRRRLLQSGAAAAIFAASGLAATAAPRRGGVLRLAVSGEAIFARLAGQGTVLDCLTEIAADGSLIGELATDWRSSDDARVWEFDLRREVRFHDGRSFGADDVVATIRPMTLRVASAPFEGGLGVVIEKRGSHRVRFTLDSPNPDFPFLLAEPKLAIRPAGSARKNPVGTGLYKADRYEPGQSLTATRIGEHWKDGRAGWFDRIEITVIGDRRARLAALLSGRADAIDDLDPMAADTMERIPRVRVTSLRGNGQLQAVIQSGRGRESFDEVMEVLRHGFPREHFASLALKGHGGVTGDTPLGPQNRHYDAAAPDWDPDRSRAMLGRAGLKRLTIGLPSGCVPPEDSLIDAFHRAGFGIAPPDATDVALRPVSGRATEDWAYSEAPASGLPWIVGCEHLDEFRSQRQAGRATATSTDRRGIYDRMGAICARHGTAAMPVHADFLMANSDRLVHGPTLGHTWTLDDARIAERWWYA